MSSGLPDPFANRDEAARARRAAELDGQLPLWPVGARQEPATGPRLVGPAGYLRALVGLYAGSSDSTLRPDEADEADEATGTPADDAPWTVLRAVRLVSGHAPDAPDTPV